MTRLMVVLLMVAAPAWGQSLRDTVRQSYPSGQIPSHAAWLAQGALLPRVAVPAPEAPPLAAPQTPQAPPGDVCLPPGMPPLADLVIVEQASTLAPEAGTGRKVAAVEVGYVTKGTLSGGPPAYVAYWVPVTGPDGQTHHEVAAVDDHPTVAAFPDWVDEGMVNDHGETLPNRHPTCKWHRLPVSGGQQT